ncbi:MAG: Hsp70 family protein, partial [Thermoanaerobaculia bacterium]
LPLLFVEDELAAEVVRHDFDEAVAAKTERLHATAAKCIREAGLKRDAIHTVFFTGGSSRVPAVRDAIVRAALAARIASGSDFLSVALGLTREAQKRFD